MRHFDTTERYVLMKVYSRQRIDHWERVGYVPIHQCKRVSDLIGRRVEDLLPEEKPMPDTAP